jgi:hypothetical protein
LYECRGTTTITQRYAEVVYETTRSYGTSIKNENVMKIDITMEDYGIIINALHYYKKVEKKGNFQQYNCKRINELRDKLSHQMVWEQCGEDT